MADKKKAALFYGVVGCLFLACGMFTLYYGKQAFYVEKPVVHAVEYDYHVAFVSEETGNGYWRSLERGAQTEAERSHIYLESVGPNHSDAEETLRLIDRMVAADVDGIVMQGFSSTYANDLVTKAMEHGIPIVTVNSDMPDSNRAAYVGIDHYDAGFRAGKELLRATEGRIFVGLVTGKLELLDQQLTVEGFEDAIAESDRIDMVAVKEANHTESSATHTTYDLLRQYPEINALISTSALNGSGVVQGVNESAVAKRPYILAFDFVNREVSLASGELNALIVNDPEEVGARAIELMLELQTNGSSTVEWVEPIPSLMIRPQEQGAGGV